MTAAIENLRQWASEAPGRFWQIQSLVPNVVHIEVQQDGFITQQSLAYEPVRTATGDIVAAAIAELTGQIAAHRKKHGLDPEPDEMPDETPAPAE